MSKYTALIEWSNDSDTILDNEYSRAHTWAFDGGVCIPASSSPAVVPEPWSVAANVDPEEAFVASLSSCHMLWFLSIAANRGLNVKSYTDKAEGVMAKNDAGKMAMTKVTLNPKIEFDNTPPNSDLKSLHASAHRQCFIANSVNSEIIINTSNNR